MPRPAAHRLVAGKGACGHPVGAKRLAIIDEGADREARGELRRAARMVGVEMGDQEVVDPIEPGRRDRVEDPPRVASADASAIAG
jgi:hypothetical protein